MTLSNMAIAELSILISFLCFLAIVIKKIWPVLMGSLDSYVENVKNQINSAEKLREESAAALIRADKISSSIQSEIEKYKKQSEERIAQLEEENRRYIQALKEKAAQSLEAQMNAELSKQKEMLVDRLADLIAEKLAEKSKDLSGDVNFSEEDLRKLTR